MPLHDHPNMCVISKLLCGELYARSFSHINQSTDQSASSSQSSQVKLQLNEIKCSKDEPWFLTPEGWPINLWPPAINFFVIDEDGNIHEFKALSPCAIFDILLPPYASNLRDCHYYHVFQSFQAGKGKLLLWLIYNAFPILYRDMGAATVTGGRSCHTSLFHSI